MRIDAHQHFWLYQKQRDSWITEEMSVIQRNFLPNDISGTLKSNNFDGIVAVQADQSIAETNFLLELAGVYKVIKGIVGWIDFQDDNFQQQLDEFKKHELIKGFRHIIEAEADENYLTTDIFLRGIEKLTQYNYTYDLLIRPRHYKSTIECVKHNPNQSFILDHMAKPAIKLQEFDQWGMFIEDLSSFRNVHCKISGLATEAEWNNWTLDNFYQYINHVIKCFGPDRILFGSDWPVCLLAASFNECLEIVEHSIKDFTAEQKEKFWGVNAQNFYKLK